MFLVSGVELVAAACRAGIAGAFPTANCRSTDELEAWLLQLRERNASLADRAGHKAGPVVPNLVVHPSNRRLESDLGVLCRHRPDLVITSVGSPASVLPALHDAGVPVFADVASLRHARRALTLGVDGLVLLTAGAGGQTGWLNPFAFVRAVRAFFDGPLVLAGGIADGWALHAAEALGCTLGYMGTRFIAAAESLAAPGYRRMLVDSSADDIVLTRAFTGLDANFLRPSIEACGLDPDHLSAAGEVDVSRDIDVASERSPFKRWKDLWSAGHTVSGVKRIATVADIVAETEAEYHAARNPPQETTRLSLQEQP